LAKKSIFAVGFDLPDIEGFETLSFSSGRSLLDADVIAAELMLSEFQSYQEYDGRPLLSESSSFKYRELRQHWGKQIATALEAGKTVVFFLTEREDMFFYTGTRDISGTGRNQKITNIVSQASNYDFLPVKLVKASYGKRRSMVLDSGADLIAEFWSQVGSRMEYNCVFEVDKLKPLIRTKAGGHIVGAGDVTTYGGALLVLPDINWDDIEELERNESREPIVDEDGDYVRTDEILQFTRQLRDALLGIENQIKKDREGTPPPAWSEAPEYRLAAEATLESDVLKLGAWIEKLEAQRAQRRAELKAQGALRHLLFEKGLPLSVREGLPLEAAGS
jgi:hypothetical protein